MAGSTRLRVRRAAAGPGPSTPQAVERATVEQPEFYALIAERNLFRPLGWEPPDPKPQYALLLTTVAQPGAVQAPNPEASFWGAVLGEAPSGPPSASAPERPSRALIADLRSGAVFYRSVGEQLGEMTLVDIAVGRVTLGGEDGETTELEFHGGRAGRGPESGARRGRVRWVRGSDGTWTAVASAADGDGDGTGATTRGRSSTRRGQGRSGTSGDGGKAAGRVGSAGEDAGEDGGNDGAEDEEEDADAEKEKEEAEEDEEAEGGVYVEEKEDADDDDEGTDDEKAEEGEDGDDEDRKVEEERRRRAGAEEEREDRDDDVGRRARGGLRDR